MFRIPRIFLSGNSGTARRVSSLRWTAASPMTSMRRITASCFSVWSEICLRRVPHIQCDQARCFQYVAQSPDLVSFHKRKPTWTEYAHARSGSGTSQGRHAARNPQGDRQVLPLHPPFPTSLPLKPALTHRALPANPHHCRDRPGRARRSRKCPADESGSFRRMGVIGLAAQPKKGFGGFFACLEGNDGLPMAQGIEIYPTFQHSRTPLLT